MDNSVNHEAWVLSGSTLYRRKCFQHAEGIETQERHIHIYIFILIHLYLFKGTKNLGAQGVVVVVDDVFDLPGPVYHDALQVLNEILKAAKKRSPQRRVKDTAR